MVGAFQALSVLSILISFILLGIALFTNKLTVVTDEDVKNLSKFSEKDGTIPLKLINNINSPAKSVRVMKIVSIVVSCNQLFLLIGYIVLEYIRRGY